MQCLIVGVSGAAGALMRFGLNTAAAAMLPGRAWIGTLTINLTGSFILGWFLAAYGAKFAPTHPARLAVAVGFLGAYTTFSTFTYEADQMLRGGQVGTFTFYILGSIVLGVLACAAGVAMGR